MKIINQDNNSITVEIGFLKQLSLFIRLIGGVFTVIVVASLVTEGINIISFILLLVVVLLYPLMVAKGTIVITHDALIETKRTCNEIWRLSLQFSRPELRSETIS